MFSFLNFTHLLYIQDHDVQDFVDSSENIDGWVKISSKNQIGLQNCFEKCYQAVLDRRNDIRNVRIRDQHRCCMVL